METLVVVAQPRDRYYSRNKSQGTLQFGSSPSEGFRDLNCRAFESGMGLIPIPTRACLTPQSNRSHSSPKTPNFLVHSAGNSKCHDVEHLKRAVGSSPIPLNSKGGKKERPFRDNICFSEIWVGPAYSNSPLADGSLIEGKKERTHGDNISFSERWAGPAYSNSPPPSSLPMPRFSMKPKRTVSLELPLPESDLNLPPFAKSAPASPTRDVSCSLSSFLTNEDSATKTLRRILNLDVCDD